MKDGATGDPQGSLEEFEKGEDGWIRCLIPSSYNAHGGAMMTKLFLEIETPLLTPLPPAEAPQALLQILMSDFAAMRSQIYALMNFEVQMVNCALAFLGVLVAAFTQTAVLDIVNRSPRVLLYLAGVFVLFGIMHIYEKFRVYQTVAYIETYISPQIRMLTGRPPLLNWEDFLGHCYRTSPLLSLVALLRSALFALPPLFLLAYFVIAKKNDFNMVDTIALFTLLLVGLSYAAANRALSFLGAQRLVNEFRNR